MYLSGNPSGRGRVKINETKSYEEFVGCDYPRGKGVVTIPKKLKSSGIKRLMERALWAQGVRSKLRPGKKRHEFQADHGFRKWFKTRCELAGMKSINVETLMGNSIGIQDSYYRATEEELLQDYLKAVPFLSVNETHILQEQIDELTEKALSVYSGVDANANILSFGLVYGWNVS